MARAQGAVLDFEGYQIKPAYTAFAKWLSVEHDRKGAQMGAIVYGNGKVGFLSIQFCNTFGNCPNRSGSNWCSSTTGQSPQVVYTMTYLTSRTRPSQSYKVTSPNSYQA